MRAILGRATCGKEGSVDSSHCWQFVVKSNHKVGPLVASARPEDVRVERISFSDAAAFITKYEWLGTMGSAKYCFGLLRGPLLLGVVCYTSPSSPGAFKRLLGPDLVGRVLQLCRGASAPGAPVWTGSMLISQSLRILAREQGAVAVVAFADPAAGELGIVYQAANAYYLGLTNSRGPGHYLILGKLYHARAVQKHFGSAAHAWLSELDPSYRRIQRSRKHRYLFIIARGASRNSIIRSISPLVQPPPKRRLTTPTQRGAA